MRKRSYSNSLMALCLIIVISGLLGMACGGSSNQVNTNAPALTPQPTPNPCAEFTDQMIVGIIYGQLIKDPDIFPQIKQINVTAKAGVVTVEGWVSDKDRYDKVLGIAETSKCVIPPVIVNGFYDHTPNPTQPSPGCVPPLTRCGDICVPGQCFWSVDAPKPIDPTTKANTGPAANTMTSSNKPVNANMKSSSNSNTKY